MGVVVGSSRSPHSESYMYMFAVTASSSRFQIVDMYGGKCPIQRFSKIVPKRTNLYRNKPRGIIFCFQV